MDDLFAGHYHAVLFLCDLYGDRWLLEVAGICTAYHAWRSQTEAIGLAGRQRIPGDGPFPGRRVFYTGQSAAYDDQRAQGVEPFAALFARRLIAPLCKYYRHIRKLGDGHVAHGIFPCLYLPLCYLEAFPGDPVLDHGRVYCGVSVLGTGMGMREENNPADRLSIFNA